jgi:hypothetical protein
MNKLSKNAIRTTLVLIFGTLGVFSGELLAKDLTYRAPRLASGHPNFEAMWVQSNNTPLERPTEFKTLQISPDQVHAYETKLKAFLDNPSAIAESIGTFPDKLMEPIRGELRSSIIVNPTTGKIPGTQRFNEWLGKLPFNTMNATDGPEQRPASERCLGNPNAQPPILAVGYYLHQIVQTRDTVLFVSEWAHSARVIRLNARHASNAVTSWLGDSIGHWDGDTLVVETTQFTASDPGRAGPRISFRVSQNTRVTERFTRVSANQLDYSFTVEDPLYYTQAWTGETHFRRTDERMFEDSCHEGNRSLVYVLQGGRVADGTWPLN